MPLRNWLDRAEVVPGARGSARLDVDRRDWRGAAEELARAGAHLVSLWASLDTRAHPCVNGAYRVYPAATPPAGRNTVHEDTGLLVLRCALDAQSAIFPGIEDLFPAADRLQRAATDLSGVRPAGPQRRPWLRHAAWPADFRPLRHPVMPTTGMEPAIDNYAFVRVEGDGVHEIPVGPVHAGIIEPGHFHFSVVGEKVLRLEQHLGYVHKGIERRFQEMPIAGGHRLAARISGDSAVAFSWAYCQALEGLAGSELPARAAWLRALALELERIANHLGDLGALGNDAGFAFGLSQFMRLKEQCLRATEAALGQRYLMDYVVPGGAREDLTSAAGLLRCVSEIEPEVLRLREIYDEHAGVRDRFAGAGIVLPRLAAQLGLTGLAGRASGQAFDLRCDLPCPPYAELAPRKAGSEDGDVAARVAVRFDELLESLRLVRAILDGIPAGTHHAVTAPAPSDAFAIGLIEGWRGPVLIALESGRNGSIRRCHPHDPSSLNWPVLEHAVIGNIVPDFPLINKSFNLSYSGHDV